MFVSVLTALAILASIGSTSAAPERPLSDAEEKQRDTLRFAEECEPWDDWDKPAQPFRIHGNTYYVGTCGIAAILITSNDGHVLIDSGTEAGSDVVLGNIVRLGFALEDVEILLSSHEHFDHVGGHAKIVERTGATIGASPAAKRVLESGNVGPDDPQFEIHPSMTPVKVGFEIVSGRSVRVGGLKIYHFTTAGHTPGAKSYFWETCEGRRCRYIVYADSMSAVSSDTYRFSQHPAYVAEFRKGIERLGNMDQRCDILLTPHPAASFMNQRASTGRIEGGITCSEYAAAAERRLNARLEREAGANQ